MDFEIFEEWCMIIGITLLIGYMAFIMWDLGRKSNAGRFGKIIIFIVLGLGILGFIIKTVVMKMMEA